MGCPVLKRDLVYLTHLTSVSELYTLVKCASARTVRPAHLTSVQRGHLLPQEIH